MAHHGQEVVNPIGEEHQMRVLWLKSSTQKLKTTSREVGAAETLFKEQL